MALSDTNANLRRSNSTAALTGMMNAASVQLADSPGAKKAFENLQKTSMKILEDSEKSRKEVAAELRMQRKSIERSEGMDSAQARSIKKMIEELEKANALNATRSSGAIADKTFKGLGTLLTASLTSSPLLTMGAGKLGDIIGDKREKTKQRKEAERAQQMEIEQEQILHENEMEAVAQAMNNEEVIHKENVKNALEFAKNEQERSEIIHQAKRQAVKDAIAKKNQNAAIEDQEKRTNDLFEKMGLSRTSSSSSDNRGGTTAGVGAASDVLDSSNRNSSNVSTNDDGLGDDIFDIGLGGNDPYLAQLVSLFKELIHVTENPKANSLELEEQRERRRERKRAQKRDRQKLSIASAGGMGAAAAGGGGGFLSGMAGDILGGMAGAGGMKGMGKFFKKIMPVAIGAAIAVPGLKKLFGTPEVDVDTKTKAAAAAEQAKNDAKVTADADAKAKISANEAAAKERLRRLSTNSTATADIEKNAAQNKLLADANSGSNVDERNARRQQDFDTVDQGKIKADIAAQKLESDIENQRKASRNASSRELRARRKHAETLKKLSEAETERLSRTNKTNSTNTAENLRAENKLKLQADIDAKNAKDALKTKVAEAEKLKKLKATELDIEKQRELSRNEAFDSQKKISAAKKLKLKQERARLMTEIASQENAIPKTIGKPTPRPPTGAFTAPGQNQMPTSMSSPTLPGSKVDGPIRAVTPKVPTADLSMPDRRISAVPNPSGYSPKVPVNGRVNAPTGALGGNKELFPKGALKKLPMFATKSAGKFLTKAIPVLGLGAGAWFAGEKLLKGDWFGAAGELASIPLPSISGSAVDMTTMVQEVYNDMFGDPNSSVNSERFPAGYDAKNDPQLFGQRSKVITKAIQDKIKEGHQNYKSANETRIQKAAAEREKARQAKRQIGIDKGFLKTANEPARIDVGDGRMMSREEIESATNEELFPELTKEINERGFFSKVLGGDARHTKRRVLMQQSGALRTEKNQFLKSEGLIDKSGRPTNQFELNRGPSSDIKGNMTDQNIKTEASAQISSNQMLKAKQQVAAAMGNVNVTPTTVTNDNSRVSNNYGVGGDTIRNNDASVVLAKFGLNSGIGYS